jgi:hypothetical protein
MKHRSHHAGALDSFARHRGSKISDTNDPVDFADFASRNEDCIAPETIRMPGCATTITPKAMLTSPAAVAAHVLFLTDANAARAIRQ